MDQVLLKALELADAIRSSTEYTELLQARKQMEEDEEAREALKAYDQLFSRIRQDLSRGNISSPEAREQMENAKEKRDSVPSIRLYNEKHECYLRLYDNMNQILSNVLGGEGKACGDCDSCGGCLRKS